MPISIWNQSQDVTLTAYVWEFISVNRDVLRQSFGEIIGQLTDDQKPVPFALSDFRSSEGTVYAILVIFESGEDQAEQGLYQRVETVIHDLDGRNATDPTPIGDVLKLSIRNWYTEHHGHRRAEHFLAGCSIDYSSLSS